MLKLLGLAHFIPHTSMAGEVCYLQDLFTDPAARLARVLAPASCE